MARNFVDALLDATFSRRTLKAKLQEVASAFDYIPAAQHAAIAAGTSSYDATADLNRATSEQTDLILNRGTYKTTGVIDLRTCSVRGQKGAEISATNPAEAIVRMGGSYQRYRGFNLEFETYPGNTPTAVGIEFYALRRSRVSDMRIQKTYRALYIPEVDTGAVAGADNFIYSVSFDNLQILNFHDRGIHLHAYNGGNTGCTFNNIYMNGENFSGGKRRPVNFIDLDDWSEVFFEQLNLEHAELGNAAIMFGTSVNTVKIGGLHIEGVDPYSNTFDGLIRCNGTTALTIDGMVWSYSNILQANIGGTTYPLFKLATNTKIILNNFRERNNTKDAAVTFSIANYAGNSAGTASIEGTNIESDLINVVINNQPATVLPILRKWNDIRDKRVGTLTGSSTVSLNSTTPQTVFRRVAAMTGNQHVDISTATVPAGFRLLVYRTSAATGAFNLTVGPGSTSSSAIATLSGASTKAELIYNGTTWDAI